MTTTVDLLDAIRAHLVEFELPAISSVHVAASIPASQVAVQLAGQLPEIARALLAWADNARWGHRRSVAGPSGGLRTPVGDRPANRWRLRSRLWRLGFIERGLSADLAPNATTTIPLAALRHAATLGDVTA